MCRNYNNEKQRWSLRKASVGLVSILLGLTLFTTSQTVHADTNGNMNTTVQVDKSVKTDKDIALQQSKLTDKPQSVSNADKPEGNGLQSKIDQATKNGQDKVKNIKDTVEGISNKEGNLKNKIDQNGNDIQKDIDTAGKLAEKNDQSKNVEEYKSSKENLLRKYDDIIQKSEKNNKWQGDFPDESVLQKEEKDFSIKINVEEPKDESATPMLNNTIVYNGKSYNYTANDGTSSVFGYTLPEGNAAGWSYSADNVIPNFSTDLGYLWTKEGGNLIIRHDFTYQVDLVNKDAPTYDIYKENGETYVDDTEYDDDDNDVEYKSMHSGLDIREYLILTSKGNLIHKVQFKNTSDDENFVEPQRYFTLIDTSLNGKDGVPVYYDGKGGVYITDGSIIYAVHGMGDTEAVATDYSVATNSSHKMSSDIDPTIDGKENNNVLPSDVKDTAIRVITPNMILKKGETATLWYIETMGPVSEFANSTTTDDGINADINEILKKLDLIKKDVKDANDKADIILNPLDKYTDIDKLIDNTKGTLEGGSYTSDDTKDVIDDSTNKAMEEVKKGGKFNKFFSLLTTATGIKDLVSTVHDTIDSVKTAFRNFTDLVSTSVDQIKEIYAEFKKNLKGKVFRLDKLTAKQIANMTIDSKSKKLLATLKNSAHNKTEQVKDIAKAIYHDKIQKLKNKAKALYQNRIKKFTDKVKDKINNGITAVRNKLSSFVANLGTDILPKLVGSFAGPVGVFVSSMTAGMLSVYTKRLTDALVDTLWKGNYKFNIFGHKFSGKLGNYKGVNHYFTNAEDKMLDSAKGASAGMDKVVKKLSSTLEKQIDHEIDKM